MRRHFLFNLFLAMPFFLWSFLLIILPVFGMISYILYTVSLREAYIIACKYKMFSNAIYTLIISLVGSLVSVGISSVMIYATIKSSERFGKMIFYTMLTISQISFIARTIGYKLFMSSNLAINQYSQNIFGFSITSFSPLFTWNAVLATTILLILSVTYVSIYQSINFNKNLLLASMDLGANNFQTFFSIFLPSIISSLVSSYYVSVAYCVGLYFISEMVGSLNSDMIGNKISELLFVSKDVIGAMLFSLSLFIVVIISYILGKFIINCILKENAWRRNE